MTTPPDALLPLPRPALRDMPLRDIRLVLTGSGLWFDYGAASLRVRSDSAHLAAQLQSVYHGFPFHVDRRFSDLHVQIGRPGNLRRWLAQDGEDRMARQRLDRAANGCHARRAFQALPHQGSHP